METTHLPSWGPYAKELAGATFATDAERGLRVEFCFFPALYRRRQSPPFLSWDSGFHPWEAAPDLRYWRFRFPLTDKREFYADILYEAAEEGLDVTAIFVNGTDLPQAAALHGLVTRRFPEGGPYRQPPLRTASVELPPGAVWRSASDFDDLCFRENSPHRHLPADARPMGMIWGNGFVDGRGLGDGFGECTGDQATFNDLSPANRILLRYRCAKTARFIFQGKSETEITLPATDDFATLSLCVNPSETGSLTLISQGGTAVDFDGFAFLPSEASDPIFRCPPLEDVPEIVQTPGHLELVYPGDPGGFSIDWPDELRNQVREIHSDHLQFDFPLATHDHVRKVIGTPGAKHYTNLFLRPIPIAPGESREIRLRLRSTLPKSPHFLGAPAAALSPADFGIERLRATLLTNVVFPVQYKRGYIAHHCPGKFWDSLYTWDSGFIGLGMCEVNPIQAGEILRRYLCDPEDDFAYVHHGSTVPVQIHLLQTLFNLLGGDRDLLRERFAGARRMHRFLAGRTEGSITAELQSGLLCPFAYFYNSGGWDDYPPQWKLWHENRTHGVTPVITTAQIIRTAKLLRRMALLIGEDPAEFDADIQHLSEALFRHAWNPKTRWFSYVEHDAEGRAIGPMRHESGEDYNAGLDGLYPLLAGVCPPDLEAEFVERLKDPDRFWSPVGLSTVDMSAAVYKTDGYWNGSVWMPHQWFVWRYLLDIGESDFALAIAERALELWEREVRESWCCFEHFPIETRRGAGWHHFGGLSAPVLSWHGALNTPGRISGGYNCWILSHRYEPGRLEAEILLDGRTYDTPVLWIAFPGENIPGYTWSGKGALHMKRHQRMLILRFENGQDRGKLVIH
ncbi:MAG: hypothetical protein JJU29_20915 [Verrucomicrobia bacterium]|nr:hypothetical protein [Verrucomicrobiota bacterium]MCH8514271.1 hypothetical protein [Kiritimatiellia bacterium]